MAGGASGIDRATAEVSAVAHQQRGAVERLDSCVRQAIARVHGMVALADELDRRGAERVVTSMPIQVTVNGNHHPGRVLDVSNSGMRCTLDHGGDIALDQRVALAVSVGTQTVRLDATVVRRMSGGGAVEFGLAYTDPDRPGATMILDHAQATLFGTTGTTGTTGPATATGPAAGPPTGPAA